MHARRITLAVALAGVIGVGTVAAVRADDAASPAGPGVAPTPDESAPQAGAPENPTVIVIPDNDEDAATPGSTGTLLILIPRRAPDATTPAPESLPEPIPGRRTAHTVAV
jgi:hypothetical protein